MADLGAYYSGTVVVGKPVTLDAEQNNPNKSIHYKIKHFRIDVTGAITLFKSLTLGAAMKRLKLYVVDKGNDWLS